MTTSKTNKLYIPLEGVESEHCANIISNGLSKTKGIISNKVELNNKQAIVETTDGSGVLSEAVHTIRSLGYEVPTVRKIFPVTGMSCAVCANSVESMLKAQQGIVHAAVNFAAENVSVEYIPEAIHKDEMKKVVQSIGYDLIIDESDKQEETLGELHRKKFEKQKIKTIGALIFSVPLVLMVTGHSGCRILRSRFLYQCLETNTAFFSKHGFAGSIKHRSCLSVQRFQHFIPRILAF
jgi:Cu2+-exporting ATPase